MSIANNPLKQYFRRPSIYIRLPSNGADYSPGVINMPDSGEFAVYPMTAIDEITSRTPDALFNGTAVVELIKSCVPDIIDPWRISSNDLDAILIGIRSASQGNELDIDTECPKCKESSSYGVSLVSILASLKAGDYSKELQVGELSIKFRPLTYKEMNEASLNQFEIQKLFANLESADISDEERASRSKDAVKSITEITMKILAKTIERVTTPDSQVTETPYILDFLQNCDKTTYTTIRDYHTQLKASTELKPLKIKCIHCQHEYEQTYVLNASDFFG